MSEAKLISGQEYSLSDLLSSDFILSIPDLQRDYCWGVKNLKSDKTDQDEIVSSFIDSIIEESAKDHQGHSSTGLIYAYEWPKGTYQLCDGQQRITTLFLTAGILNRLLGKENNDLKKILVREDSTRTGFSALQYGIRETSLHFLDDLVVHYFLGEDELNWRSKKGERESEGALLPMGRPQWYYREYDDDITIQAILCALFIINDKLETLNIESLENIKDYILNTMTFIFYDMVSRRKGEETFVIINNTGEPLSSTENLKPRLLGMVEDDTDRKTYVKQWEAREDFFWFNRSKTEFTSDNFSKDFYDWHFWLTYEKECNREVLKDLNNSNIRSELESIELTFKSFLKFFDHCIGENAAFVKSPVDNEKIFKIVKDWENNIDILDWLRQNERKIIVIPILAYIRKFRKDGPIEEIDTLFFRKILRNYLSGKHEIENIKLGSIVKGINQAASIEDLLLILPGKYIKGDDEFNYGALKEMELDPLLRMNTDVLFSDDCTALDVITRYKNLSYLSNLGKEEFARQHIEDSNAYRVLRVLRNWGGNICHQYNKTWDLEGRPVNNLDAPKKNEEYILKYKSIYNSEAFLSLIKQKPENLSKAIFQSLKEYILKHSDILNITIENYSPESFFKAWAYAKFLVVWQSSNLLSLYDGTPFGGFRKDNPKGNMINPDGPFILANCVARTFYRGGYNHVNKEHYRITNFDSPLFDDTEMPYESWDTQNEERKQISPDFFLSINERIMKKHEDFLNSDF